MDDELKFMVAEGIVAGVLTTLLIGTVLYPEKANRIIYSVETRLRGLLTVARR